MPQRIEIVRVGVKVLCELLGGYELLGEGGRGGGREGGRGGVREGVRGGLGGG